MVAQESSDAVLHPTSGGRILNPLPSPLSFRDQSWFLPSRPSLPLLPCGSCACAGTVSPHPFSRSLSPLPTSLHGSSALAPPPCRPLLSLPSSLTCISSRQLRPCASAMSIPSLPALLPHLHLLASILRLRCSCVEPFCSFSLPGITSALPAPQPPCRGSTVPGWPTLVTSPASYNPAILSLPCSSCVLLELHKKIMLWSSLTSFFTLCDCKICFQIL
jgi:hypothetical protein